MAGGGWIVGEPVVPDRGLTVFPAPEHFLPVQDPGKFDPPFLKVSENATEREDRLNFFSEVLNGLLETANVLFEIVLFKKSARSLGRADKLMHKKGVV